MASKVYMEQEMKDLIAPAFVKVWNDIYHKRKSKIYCAAEMRESLGAVINAIDVELKKQEHCRKCEWRGKTIRGEAACPCDEDVHGVVFDIDVTDRILKALCGNEEQPVKSGNDKQEVGEWEEVPE